MQLKTNNKCKKRTKIEVRMLNNLYCLHFLEQKICKFHRKPLSLRRVFHGIRFKVNGRRSSGDALLFFVWKKGICQRGCWRRCLQMITNFDAELHTSTI